MDPNLIELVVSDVSDDSLSNKSESIKEEVKELPVVKLLSKILKAKPRILVVNDHEFLLYHLESILEDYFEVEIAENGLEAYRMVV